uniref:Uncharacterized protein n=1 Tax=Lactuca sativa TaxID=4236 RepID=A0A9R1WYN5_LACSA|nr:hypothetical protein LSAT_V11C800414920 [Lactuca sativa]
MNPNIQKIVMEVNDDSSSSEDELINNNLLPNNASSSNIQRRNTIHRDLLEAEQLLIRHYFVDDSTYGHAQFCRRFRMSKGLFIRLVGDLETNSLFSNNMGCNKSKKFQCATKMHISNTSISEGL